MMKLLPILTQLACLLTWVSPGLAASASGNPPQRAIFAGGCFWCMEKPFEQTPGVLSVISGYTGGHSDHPTYETYARDGHIEAIEITYDPTQISYAQLLDIFWHQIDPTDASGQFVDRGAQYTSAIFYLDEEQQQLAEASKRDLQQNGRFDKPIVTPIVPATTFHAAEAYHQDYYRKNPIRYWYYRSHSGRDTFLEGVWGKQLHQDAAP